MFIYRLLAAGTVEVKIYQRQLFKFFLSQKVLDDARHSKKFKWRDLHVCAVTCQVPCKV